MDGSFLSLLLVGVRSRMVQPEMLLAPAVTLLVDGFDVGVRRYCAQKRVGSLPRGTPKTKLCLSY